MPAVAAPPDLPRHLQGLRLPEADGGAVTLGQLWADQPVVLAHLRHFG